MAAQTCYIYRCAAKADMYLYIRQRDDFSDVPEALFKRLGRLDFAMQLELTADKKLARETPEAVMRNLSQQGFHLQMPATTAVDELLARIAAEQNSAAQKNTP
jgi:uncharacterized protein